MDGGMMFGEMEFETPPVVGHEVPAQGTPHTHGVPADGSVVNVKIASIRCFHTDSQHDVREPETISQQDSRRAQSSQFVQGSEFLKIGLFLLNRQGPTSRLKSVGLSKRLHA